MDYVRPSFSRMDLMVEHCMCCVVRDSSTCVVDSPITSPATLVLNRPIEDVVTLG